MPTLSDIGISFNPLKDYVIRFASINGLSEPETALLLKYIFEGVKGRGEAKEQAIAMLCEEYGVQRARFAEIYDVWMGKSK